MGRGLVVVGCGSANAYIAFFQRTDREDEVLESGTVFHVVKSLLQLNKQADKQIEEVLVMI